jgi:steroid delta-isomerase-like uncharacterized protein
VSKQTQEENKKVAERLAEVIFSKGRMEVVDGIFADSYVMHNMPVPNIPGTKEGFRKLVLETRHAFPDVQVHIDDMVAEGDFAVFHDHVEATSKGDFLGVPPNGKRIAWTEIHFLRIVNGKIVEHGANFDQFGILMQLGAIPS